MFGNMKDMMGKLQEAQAQSKEMKKRLEQVQIKEGDAQLWVLVNANREIKDIHIEQDLMQDAEEVADRLVITLNKALNKAEQIHEKEMQSLAKGMMPGLDIFK